MISITGAVTPTRVIGLTSHVFALAACLIAWMRSRRTPHPTRLVAVLTVLEVALLLDLVFNVRWMLHDLLVRAAIASHVYRQRSEPQHVALGLLAGAVVGGIGLCLWRFRRRPGAALAACGGMLSVCCWFVEVISLHEFDSLLYRRIDGVTVVRLAWAVWSLMTGVGILWDSFVARADIITRAEVRQRSRQSL